MLIQRNESRANIGIFKPGIILSLLFIFAWNKKTDTTTGGVFVISRASRIKEGIGAFRTLFLFQNKKYRYAYQQQSQARQGLFRSFEQGIQCKSSRNSDEY